MISPLLLTAALLWECHAAEVRWALPAGLLVAVVVHESSGRTRLVTPERGGRCSGAGASLRPGAAAAAAHPVGQPRPGRAHPGAVAPALFAAPPVEVLPDSLGRRLQRRVAALRQPGAAHLAPAAGQGRRVLMTILAAVCLVASIAVLLWLCCSRVE